MASDASIYSMIRPVAPPADPMDSYGKAMTLKGLMSRQEMDAMQMRQARQAMDDDAATSAAYREAGGDHAKVRDLLYGRGLHKAGISADKTALEAEARRAAIAKDNAAAGKTDFEVKIRQIEHGSSILSTARDQASYNMARQQLEAAFPGVGANMPDQFDPAFVQARIAQGQTLTQRLADQRAREQQAETNRSNVVRETETGRHNRRTEGIAGGNLAVAQGNLRLSGERLNLERGKENQPIWDAERGVFVQRPTRDPGTGELAAPAPVTVPGVGPNPTKAREDADNLRKELEGKASVKNYRDAVPIAEAARKAPDTRAGDIQLAYAVGKVLDPASVVREGELKLVGNAATIMERISGELRTVTHGKGRLTPATRAELQTMLDSAVAERKGAYDAERRSFEDIVKRRGYDPKDVIIETQPAARPAAPAAQETKVVNGKTYVKVNGQWFEQ